MNSALLSSKNMCWCTPQEFFDKLNDEFNFVLDAAATDKTAKCSLYFTPETDGLSQSWDCGGAVFYNPPYGREIGRWVQKAYREAARGGSRLCCSFLHERTRATFTTTYTEKQKSGLFEGDFGLRTTMATLLILLRFQTLSMVFLPNELEAARKIIDEAKDRAKSSHDIWFARMEDYDAWLDAQETVSSAHNVKNVATAVEIILQIFERNVTQLAEAWEDTTDDKRWVPIETIIGRTKIPAENAKVIKKALDKMIGAGKISSNNLYEGLAMLCADYIEKK